MDNQVEKTDMRRVTSVRSVIGIAKSHKNRKWVSQKTSGFFLKTSRYTGYKNGVFGVLGL